MELVAGRFEVWLVSLDPTVGSEIRKTRPCVVISPDEMNRYIRTRIVPQEAPQAFAEAVIEVDTY